MSHIYINISHFGPTRKAGRLSTSRKAKQNKQNKQNKSVGSQKRNTTSRTTRSHEGAGNYKKTAMCAVRAAAQYIGSSSYQNWEQQGLFPPHIPVPLVPEPSASSVTPAGPGLPNGMRTGVG